MRVPRFQFRLRSLLFVVALLSVSCGYVAGEARIALDRKAWLTPDRAMRMFFMVQGKPDISFMIRSGDRAQQPSQLRLWFGDSAQSALLFQTSVPPSEVEMASTLFPEADVYVIPVLGD